MRVGRGCWTGGERAKKGNARCGWKVERTKRTCVRTKATEEETGTVDSKVLQYCDISQRGKRSQRTLGEMEMEFIGAMEKFYYEGKPNMSNEEFDLLKEELMWEGSSVVMLSPLEQRFLEVSMAYAAGNPVVTDQEYDEIKNELKKQGSSVVMQGPRCSIRTQQVVSDCQLDYLRMTLLNLPATLLALGLLFVADDLSGFGITYLVELPEPWGFFTTWGLVLPGLYLVASKLTSVVLRDAEVLSGPCPNCGNQTISFFGDILGVSGNRETNTTKCEKCASTLEFNASKREIVLKEAGSQA